MEDVAAGAAFAIPEFNKLTHSYTLACPPGNLPRLEGYYYPPVVGPVSPTDKALYIRHNVLFSNEPIITGPPNGYTCGFYTGSCSGAVGFHDCELLHPPAMHQFRLAD